jgi:hypothetical protein
MKKIIIKRLYLGMAVVSLCGSIVPNMAAASGETKSFSVHNLTNDYITDVNVTPLGSNLNKNLAGNLQPGDKLEGGVVEVYGINPIWPKGNDWNIKFSVSGVSYSKNISCKIGNSGSSPRVVIRYETCSSGNSGLCKTYGAGYYVNIQQNSDSAVNAVRGCMEKA